MKKYSLSHWTSDKPDADIDDMYEHEVATSDTIAGLLRYASLKRLDDEEYFIDRNFYEITENGYKIPDSERVGYLYEIKRKAKDYVGKIVKPPPAGGKAPSR